MPLLARRRVIGPALDIYLVPSQERFIGFIVIRLLPAQLKRPSFCLSTGLDLTGRRRRRRRRDAAARERLEDLYQAGQRSVGAVCFSALSANPSQPFAYKSGLAKPGLRL